MITQYNTLYTAYVNILNRLDAVEAQLLQFTANQIPIMTALNANAAESERLLPTGAFVRLVLTLGIMTTNP